MTSLDTMPISTPSIWVREIQTSDGAALLDIRRGLCLSINHVGSRIWQLLKQQISVDQIVSLLLRAFPDVGKDQIRQDVGEFISDLTAKGLLGHAGGVRVPSRLPPLLVLMRSIQNRSVRRYGQPGFLFWKTMFWLAVYDVFGFGHDFTKFHGFVKAWPTRAGEPHPDTATRVCNILNKAISFYPRRVLCLQRSFALTCLLRGHGIPAKIVIGAQKFPFRAHAWTEVNGRAVNERRNVTEIYLIWERC